MPPRARLDPREVDPAEGELRQAAHEPARAPRRRRPRRRRRLGGAAAGAAAGAGTVGRAAPAQPDEARLVARVVLDARRAAPRRRSSSAAQRRAERRGGGGPPAARPRRPARTASAVEAPATTAAPGSRVAEEARALRRWPAGARATVAHVVERDRLARDQAVADAGGRPRRRCARPSVSTASASSVAPTAPSSEFSIGTSARSAVALLHGAGPRRRRSGSGTGSQPAARGADAAPRGCRSRPARGRRRASVRASTEPSSPASASRIASSSSGESSMLALARRSPACSTAARCRGGRSSESTTPLCSASSSAIVVDWWPDSSP